MKAYVTYYGPEPKVLEEESQAQEDARLALPPIAQFHRTPLWTVPTKEQATDELTRLQRQGLYVKQHVCDISLEELAAGGFAFVCLDHPDWTT
jgi:hypothetical protein